MLACTPQAREKESLKHLLQPNKFGKNAFDAK